MDFKKFVKFDSLSWFWLRYFGTYRDLGVRRRVAENPNTPPEILAHLADDKYWTVRINVAGNPNTPPEVLAHLARDEYWFIRLAISSHLNTPEYVKDYLNAMNFMRGYGS